MNPIELKQYIVENDKQGYILEALGCHHIKYHTSKGGYYTCGRPSGQNVVGIQLFQESLKVKIYTPDLQTSKYYTDNGDIITLTMILNDQSFFKANKWLHKELGLPYTTYQYTKKTDDDTPNMLDIFTKHTKRRRRCDVKELELIDNEIMNDFIPYCHIDWIREGITPPVAEEFAIGYSDQKKRIVIPHRLWCGTKDDFVGIMGRTTMSPELIEILGIAKYFPIKPHQKGLNLYGLQENYKYIQQENEIVIIESEKGVLKMASKFVRNLVACCCHTLTDEQVGIVIGLDVSVVISFDTDVDEFTVMAECEKFYGIRPIYYTFDKHGVLPEKSSITDMPLKIYNHMMKYKIKYDESKHEEYLRLKKEKEEKI